MAYCTWYAVKTGTGRIGMAIKTGRADTAATVRIDYDSCIHCGLCAEVCKGQPLIMAEGRLKIDNERFFGCIGCGHCMCVCPQDCIQISGRDMSPEDVLPLPDKASLPGYEQFYGLLLSRRAASAIFRIEWLSPKRLPGS